MARAAGYRVPRFLNYKQALELGGHVRKGERGTKVYFVKQLQVLMRSNHQCSRTSEVNARTREWREAHYCTGPQDLKQTSAAFAVASRSLGLTAKASWRSPVFK
jgi:N-terminal domain of anti-restriction factor ArdC